MSLADILAAKKQNKAPPTPFANPELIASISEQGASPLPQQTELSSTNRVGSSDLAK